MSLGTFYNHDILTVALISALATVITYLGDPNWCVSVMVAMMTIELDAW